MAKKDLFENLCKYYEFMTVPLPMRNEFKRALQDTVSADELSVFFLLPFSGKILFEKLKKKAGMPVEDLKARLDHTKGRGDAHSIPFYAGKGLGVLSTDLLNLTIEEAKKDEKYGWDMLQCRGEGTGVNALLTTKRVVETLVLPRDDGSLHYYRFLAAYQATIEVDGQAEEVSGETLHEMMILE